MYYVALYALYVMDPVTQVTCCFSYSSHIQVLVPKSDPPNIQKWPLFLKMRQLAISSTPWCVHRYSHCLSALLSL